MKLTETGWYSGDQKPIYWRIGVYRRKNGFAWWNGEFFSGVKKSIQLAAYWRMTHGPAKHQNIPWRGVTK